MKAIIVSRCIDYACLLSDSRDVYDIDETEDMKCPKPCKQTIYEPALSQAALSVLSVDNILNENKQMLTNKYHMALNARQRVEEHTFHKDLMYSKDITRLYFGKFIMMRMYNNEKLKLIRYCLIMIR